MPNPVLQASAVAQQAFLYLPTVQSLFAYTSWSAGMQPSTTLAARYIVLSFGALPGIHQVASLQTTVSEREYVKAGSSGYDDDDMSSEG